jgi:hypothetical protein
VLVSSIAWPSSDCLIILLLPGSGRSHLAVDHDNPPNHSLLCPRGYSYEATLTSNPSPEPLVEPRVAFIV